MTRWMIGAALALVASGPTQARMVVPEPGRPADLSATKARDVNGFYLGMPFTELSRRLPLEKLGAGDYQGTDRDITYDFGLTPLGHVDRITATQSLGNFTVDEAFLTVLNKKLCAKYGDLAGGPSRVLEWDLVQSVRDDEGDVHPFKTMWMSALVSGTSGNVTLTLTMVDFRISWADKARANQAPREAASDALRF